jgi:hypothetical protein
MTDALAQWFLLRCESKQRPWEDFARLLADPPGDDAFTTWVEELRGDDLRNDDATLLAVGPIPPSTDPSKE